MVLEGIQEMTPTIVSEVGNTLVRKTCSGEVSVSDTRLLYSVKSALPKYHTAKREIISLLKPAQM